MMKKKRLGLALGGGSVRGLAHIGILKVLKKHNIPIGYHTVFTSLNHQDIPKIYEKIAQTDFKYWRIYEFNDDLARVRFLSTLNSAKGDMAQDTFTSLKAIENLVNKP